MAVAKSDSYTEPSCYSLICYRVASLSETILDANQIANLNDQYVLGKQLGWGQFGIIRECMDKLTGKVLACKSIAKDRLVTREDVHSIKLEIEIMTRLSGHPNVVDLKAVYEEEDYVHLLMELCAGGELFNLLEKHGRFSEPEARVLFRHLMQVVMYCHDKGVVHRDLKPENILLATNSSSSSPIKLADFGLATYIKPGQSLHGTVGSPFYIAPEVLSGGYDQAADVWSAGVILYILLSGIPPFWGKTKSRIFEAVRAAELRFPSNPWDFISYSAKELIKGMLCVDASKRLTAQQVVDHLWVREDVQLSDEPHECKQNCGLDTDKGCLSPLLMHRNQDISFGSESPTMGEVQSPSFTCRSSFSSFLVDPLTPSFEPGGFSFCSSGGSNTLAFSTPVVALPSFSFFSPGNVVEQGNGALALDMNPSRVNLVERDSDLGKLFTTPDSSQCLECAAGVMDKKEVEFRKSWSGKSKPSGIRSRRNHTIGLGEFEQLDLMVTESVIRWASCTLLSTPTSLRSSLVC